MNIKFYRFVFACLEVKSLTYSISIYSKTSLNRSYGLPRTKNINLKNLQF